ncbi:MAG: hypothetical protein NC399_06520 [Muribaculum sp.]|nr:hypothetical protein [Muribaculum sp.]
MKMTDQKNADQKNANQAGRTQEAQDREEVRRREGAMRLFSALSGVDEAYLAACESAGKVSAFPGFGSLARRYGGAFAAALCLAVLGVGYLTLRTPFGIKYANDMTSESAARSGGTTYEGVAGQPEAAEDADEALLAAQSANEPKAVESQSMAEAGGSGAAESLQSSKAQSDNGQSSNAQTDGLSPDNKLDREDTTDQHAEMRELTLEQAKALAVVGGYLPKDWPAQGEITHLEGDDTEGAERISVTWTYANQWDTFLLSVENLGTELPSYVKEALADKEKPETYDESLYDIPYAETVPRAYWTVFQDPVFEEDAFDKDCVRARLLPHSGDGGDTATPGGLFSILYRAGDQYVLLRFNGRGSVDEIWELLNSMGGR